MIRVSISVLHFGEISTTVECLKSLDRLELSGIELSVLVINNDLRVKFPDDVGDYKNLDIEIMNNKRNTGFSGGHNQGIGYAVLNNSNYHIVLNNDVVVDKYLVKKLTEAMEMDGKIGLAAPKIYFSPGREYHKKRYKKSEIGKVIWYAGGIIDWKNLINRHRGVDDVDVGQYESTEDTDFATGACMIISRKVMQEIRGFDERYFLYYEDGDLNMRAKELGYRIVFVPKAKLWHSNAASSGAGSGLQDYYITRNRMLFGLKFAPLRTKSALIKESVSILFRGRKWQKNGIRDFYLRRFGKGSYPV